MTLGKKGGVEKVRVGLVVWEKMMVDGKMPPRGRRNALDALVITIEDHLNNTLCSPHLTRQYWMMSKELDREMECPICFCSLVPTDKDLAAPPNGFCLRRCGHVQCTNCFLQQLLQEDVNCPECRT